MGSGDNVGHSGLYQAEETEREGSGICASRSDTRSEERQEVCVHVKTQTRKYEQDRGPYESRSKEVKSRKLLTENGKYRVELKIRNLFERIVR